MESPDVNPEEVFQFLVFTFSIYCRKKATFHLLISITIAQILGCSPLRGIPVDVFFIEEPKYQHFYFPKLIYLFRITHGNPQTMTEVCTTKVIPMCECKLLMKLVL